MKLAIVAAVISVCGYAQADNFDSSEVTTRASEGRNRIEHKAKRFGFRLLYQPSYRFLSADMLDMGGKNLAEVKQIYPIGGGFEGEVRVSDLLSLAVGGYYTYASPIFTIKDRRLQTDMIWESSGYDLNFWSGLFYRVRDYFKSGGGVGLSRYKLHIRTDDTVDQKVHNMDFGWYTLSVHLALRKDFRLTYGGFGVGLSAVIPVTKPFGRKIEVDDGEAELYDEHEENPFSYILMPALYFTL